MTSSKKKIPLTLSEFLNNEKNQKVILEKIISLLREKEEWGRHGLFANIAKQTGLSQAYVGRVLAGKTPFRENFIIKMADYLGIPVSSLRDETMIPPSDEHERGIEEGFDKKLLMIIIREVGYYLAKENKLEDKEENLSLLSRVSVDIYEKLRGDKRKNEKEIKAECKKTLEKYKDNLK